MMILVWLTGSAVVLTTLGAWLSRRFGRGAFQDSYENPLNEIQGTVFYRMWPF